MSKETVSLIATNTQASMNHKEIADLVESRSDKVKQSIERLADKGVIRLPPMGDFEKINNLGIPVTRKFYVFEGEQGKRDSIIVVAQLSPEFTARLVDRWMELEKEKAVSPASGFHVPQTKVEALALALELAKENEKLAEERDEAIRTKAQISQTREATACQRNAVYQRLANNAIKEREEMAALLGASKEWASTRAVWRATGMWYGYRRLMNWCDDHNMPDTYCFDPKTDDRMLCYPRQAWVEIYGVDIAKLF